MALVPQKASIPFGGGLGEDVDKDVIDPPFLAEARDIRHDIAGAIRKRRGFEAMNGTDLPADANGMNCVFDHNGGPGALGRQGCFVYSQTRDRWHRANISGTAPVTVDFHSTVYQSGKVRNYDLAVSGNFIVEVWRRDDSTNGEIWYQVRDAQNKVILQQPKKTVLVGNPRVVVTNTNGGDAVIFGFNAATPTTLQAVVLTPASSLAVGAAVSIATLVGAYDVSSDGTTNIYVAKKHSASTAVSVFRLNAALTVVNSQNPLPTLVCNDGLAVYYEPTVNQRVFVACINGAQVDGSWLAQNLAAENNVPALLAMAAAAGNYNSNGRVAIHARGSTGGVLVAASGTVVSGTKGLARASWEGFTAALASATAEFSLPHMMLAGKPWRPANFGPVVPFEYYFGHNGGADARQTAILLMTMDELELDGQGNPIGYPIVLARYAGSISANRDNAAGLSASAVGEHLCHAVPYGTKWLQGATVLTSKRVLGTAREEFAVRALAADSTGRPGDTSHSMYPASASFLRVADATAGKLHEFDFAPPPVSIVKFDDVTLFASSLCTQFDGAEYAEQSIHFWPEIALVELAGAGSLTGTFKFTVVFTIEDAVGNTHRTAPALTSAELAPSSNVVRVKYTLPPSTNFRTERGHKIRVQLYATEDGLVDGPLYFVKEEDPVIDAANSVLGRIEWDGTTPVTKLTLLDQPTIYTTGGVLEAQPPPSLRAIAATPKRLFGINSEAPWEIVATKLANTLVSPEWNGALAIIATARNHFTAMGAMDDKVIVCTADNVFWLSGDGPDDLGRGSFSGPTLIPSDTGCVNPRSMVEGPFGVMFQGRRGFYIVSRGLSIEYVGGPVEITLRDLTIRAAVDVPEEQEVRFFTAENVTLVYHYRRQQWSTRRSSGVHATLAAGRYTVGKHDVAGWAVIRERLESDTNFEDEGIQDSEAPDLENKTRIVTGWIKLDGLQGFKRVWRALFLGQHWSGNLIVEIGYDHDPAWVELRQWDEGTAPLLGGGVRAQLEFTPKRQVCQAIRFRLTEDLTGLTATKGRGFQFSSILLKYGVKPGGYKGLAAANRK